MKQGNLITVQDLSFIPLKENVHYNALSLIKVDIYTTFMQAWLNRLCKNRKNTLCISSGKRKRNLRGSLGE